MREASLADGGRSPVAFLVLAAAALFSLVFAAWLIQVTTEQFRRSRRGGSLA